MKRKILLIGIILSFILVPFTTQISARGHRSYSSHSSYTSHRSSYHTGHYAGGKGSSHKGGHYKNSSTNDHYRKR